jgi:hypothetical protein
MQVKGSPRKYFYFWNVFVALIKAKYSLLFLLNSFVLLPTLVLAQSSEEYETYKYFISAVKEKDYDKIEIYINSGININHFPSKWRDELEPNALMVAIGTRDEKLVKYLLDNGADASKGFVEKKSTNTWGQVPVHEFYYINHYPLNYALDQGSLEINKLIFISRGVDFTTAVFNILRYNDITWLNYFVQFCDIKNFNIRRVTWEQKTESPIEIAVKNKYYVTVRYLLEKMPSLATPRLLTIATKNNDLQMLDLLFEFKIEMPTTYTKEGRDSYNCPIFEAITEKNLTLVKYFVEKRNANLNSTGYSNRSGKIVNLIDYNARSGHAKIGEYLVLAKLRGNE